MSSRFGSGGDEAATPLERVAIVVVSVALSIGLIVLLSGFFAARDQAGVSGTQNGPGQRFPDQGHVHLSAGVLRPVYNSDPPTSGAHIPEPLLHDGVELSSDQLLEALELGDVVLMYGGPAPPPGLTAVARSAAPPFTPALAAAGQALIIAPRRRTAGIYALAWTRLLHVRSAADPTLRSFVETWLGKGAPNSR